MAIILNSPAIINGAQETQFDLFLIYRRKMAYYKLTTVPFALMIQLIANQIITDSLFD